MVHHHVIDAARMAKADTGLARRLPLYFYKDEYMRYTKYVSSWQPALRCFCGPALRSRLRGARPPLPFYEVIQ